MLRVIVCPLKSELVFQVLFALSVWRQRRIITGGLALAGLGNGAQEQGKGKSPAIDAYIGVPLYRRKLPRILDMLKVELSGIVNQPGGLNEEVEIYRDPDCFDSERG